MKVKQEDLIMGLAAMQSTQDVLLDNLEDDLKIALISSEISAKLTTDVSKGLTHIPASLKYARSPK